MEVRVSMFVAPSQSMVATLIEGSMILTAIIHVVLSPDIHIHV